MKREYVERRFDESEHYIQRLENRLHKLENNSAHKPTPDDVDMENNLTYLNAEIRPWANWFYMAAGVGYVDQEYELQAREDGGNIRLDNQDTGLSTLAYDLDYDSKIAPYLGLGFSPAITNRWGVFGEVGAYYTGNPSVSNVRATGGNWEDNEAVRNHIDNVRNDDKYEWLPVAKLGVTYRF